MRKERKYNDPRLNLAIDELNGYRNRLQEIAMLAEKRAEYEEMYSEIRAIAYDDVRVQGGEIKSKLEELACKWADLDMTIKNMQAENERALWEVKVKLEELPPQKAKVLELYYIKGFSLIKIAQIMNYSFEGVRKLKKAGLVQYSRTFC